MSRRWPVWAQCASCGIAEAVLAFAATFVHAARWDIGPWKGAPLGMVLAGALVMAAAIAARAWAGYWGVVAAAVGAFVATQAAALAGPGGDVLIPAQSLGYLWLVLAPTLPVVVAFAPRRWFADAPEPIGELNASHPLPPEPPGGQ